MSLKAWCIRKCRSLSGRSSDHDRLRAYLRGHGYRFAAEDKVYYCEP